jgi:hypothetical protein
MELMRVRHADQVAMQHVARVRCDADSARAHAHTYPRFRIAALRRDRTDDIEPSPVIAVKQRFCEPHAFCETINSTCVTEHSGQARNRTDAHRFDIFNMRRAMGTMRTHGSVFPPPKKRPRPASGPFDITKDNNDASEHTDQNVMLQLLM